MRWLLIVGMIFALAADAPPGFSVTYHIEPKSRLFLNGSTNINTFQCFCTDVFQPARLSGTIDEKTGSISFHKASLELTTTRISCKNKLMNKDLHKALKAEKFPHIRLELLQAIPVQAGHPNESNIWYSYRANTVLSIAGVSKPMQITLQLNRQAGNRFRLLASKDVLMSEFEVKPRTPFNMVRIDDLIVLNFDLHLQVQ